ncbi:hypothetical protein FBU30_000998 [Linnemannia zychae]|nr:hypothetical protein FBU30_000998 [Linnemannia zychae]
MKPTVPEPGDRIETTQQLVSCSMLLAEFSTPTSGLIEQTVQEEEINAQRQPGISNLPTDGEIPADIASQEWIRSNREDQTEQENIHNLVSKMVEEFIKMALKDSSTISEIVLLGPILGQEQFRKLLSCFIGQFEQSRILDVDLLQGLVQLVQCAPKGYLIADDLVVILSTLRKRLEGTHQQSAEHPYHLTLAVSCVLDVMAENRVEDLNRVLEQEPLSEVLSSLKGSSDPYLMYQALYASQALLYVPNDETVLKALIRHGSQIAGGAAKVATITRLDFQSVMEGLGELQKAFVDGIEITRNVYEGVSALVKSGQEFLEVFSGEAMFSQKHPWYSAVSAARAFVHNELNQLIYQAPCRDNSLFQWGICQILGEIANDPIWTISIRQQSIDLLEELYKNDSQWGQDISVKNWMISIITQLSESKDEEIKTKALNLLQDLNMDGINAIRHPYPLRNRLPAPESSSFLIRVQNIPNVELGVKELRQQSKNNHQTVYTPSQAKQAVYIPPLAKASFQAPDDDTFPLMEKVQEFLTSERQVMLILGDSGTGKSTFNRHLEQYLWTHYEQGGPIPLLICLPMIDQPDYDLVGKHLRMKNISDEMIHEMKQHRKFILICDGYDESHQTKNLHKTNLLNQPGQWNAKMLISCRSQYVGLTYHNKFKPQPMDRYSSNSNDLFQEAVIVPFSKDQIKSYIEQFSQTRSVWSAEEYMEKITAVPNLVDLVKNPYLLSLSLVTLPGLADSTQDLSNIKITRVGIYDKFIERWLEIDLQRHEESNLSSDERTVLEMLMEGGFVNQAIQYLEKLAESIFKEQEGYPIVQYSQLKDADTWKEDLFSNDLSIRFFRDTSFITRTGDQYRFVHRSVLEYFYSRVISKPSHQKGDTSSITVPFDVSGPMFQKNLCKEHSVVQFLCDRAQLNTDFKQRLHAVVELSKICPTANQAAANAITILVKSGVLFNGADLRGIRIPNADLSNGQFDNAQFQGADLEGIDLTRSWLRNADFSQARMHDVRFGELPYLTNPSCALSCAFSLDGKLLAVGLFLEGIMIFDTETWSELHTLKAQNESVKSLAYSPNDSYQLVSGADLAVTLWDSFNNKKIINMNGHTKCVTAVTFSPNGDHIASASKDMTVRIWCSSTGNSLFVLEGHRNEVSSLVYSPRGQYLISGCHEGIIRMWDSKTGVATSVCTTSNLKVYCLAHSSDGRWIASGHEEGKISLWNARNGTNKTTLLGHDSRVCSIAFSPCSQYLASASLDKNVRLWHVLTGTLISVFSGHNCEVTALAFSRDGSKVASVSRDRSVRLWEVRSSSESSSESNLNLQQGHIKPVSGVVYSPDGKSVISCSRDKTARQWDASTGASGSFFLQLQDTIQSLAYSPTSECIATVGNYDNNNITLWNSRSSDNKIILSGHTDAINSLAYSSCGRWIITTSLDKSTRLWDIQFPGSNYILTNEHMEETKAAVFSPCGTRFVTAGVSDVVQVWDVQSREVIATLQHQEKIHYAVAFSPDGQQIALGGQDEQLILWDGQSETLVTEIHEHRDRISCIAYSPDGRWIASGSADKTVRLWRCANIMLPEKDRKPIVVNFSGPVRSIAWNPKIPTEFVTGCEDHSVRVWRLDEHEENVRVCMVWGSNIGQLVVSDLKIEDAIDLSDINRNLLVQRRTVHGI